MASTFGNVIQSGLGTTPTTVLTTANPGNTTVIGFSLTNTTQALVVASIQLNNGSATAYFMNNVVIPAGQSLRVITGGEKLILAASTQVIITSSQASSLDIVISYVVIT
jgi:hypothetical protein